MSSLNRWKFGFYKFFRLSVAEEIKPSHATEFGIDVDIIYYPSIGVSEYPYTDWKMKDRDYAFSTIARLEEIYHGICRAFRNKWNWSPLDIDEMCLLRILRIFDELVEDEKKHGDTN